MALRKNHRQLIDEATEKITTLTLEEAQEKLADPGALFVDIRDVRELEREGQIPGAFHAPRGMLEFWVDPESPYFKPELEGTERELVLYCQSGWRSALSTATLADMGVEKVSHVEGGFGAWKKAGLPTAERERKS
ncbi:rhodanese-like domain-containing protein [Actinomycetospora termitidis]|uniref:Rhodanese-like domain-containing protein n=1 Tax=Actinomycetospora termitidis TaxID=3053470 RepID=A0ABT7M1Y3_9PSEU|nr:rhodanese-like domain-containing protein [Actinomycetospora sp. Odt1-22]MDL5154668.1 rhodanese-like domain-containing protein [Actinomycetospora sp. Odt1-22]